MSTPEGRIKNRLNRALDKRFPTHYRFMPVQMGLGASTLDYLICIDGLFFGVETKAPGKKPTPRQKTIIDKIELAGGCTFVVNSNQSISEALAGMSVLVRRKKLRQLK